ncbi:MAG: hypothetical protein DHS20C13_30820 [Thermodesulfobacteriota bacterium]|nr:MAG: hypothetical protein DHS20C13_30820 [Thermodesulfobacteriota bacterium]
MDILGMIEINGVVMDAICQDADMVMVMVIWDKVPDTDCGWDKDTITKVLRWFTKRTTKLRDPEILLSDTDKLTFFAIKLNTLFMVNY